MPNYLDLEVQLDGMSPRIWRRFLLHERASFLDLHHAIQAACGWEDRHLFVFRNASGQSLAGIPDDGGWGEPEPDAAKVRAVDELRKRWAVHYEYDFGDGWEHTVEVKDIVSLPERFTRRLLDGGRAFPPEDCGGVPGYEDVLAVAAGREAQYHDTDALQEWYRDWDPERFDLEGVRRVFDI